jgi:hypothetical protein
MPIEVEVFEQDDSRGHVDNGIHANPLTAGRNHRGEESVYGCESVLIRVVTN